MKSLLRSVFLPGMLLIALSFYSCQRNQKNRTGSSDDRYDLRNAIQVNLDTLLSDGQRMLESPGSGQERRYNDSLSRHMGLIQQAIVEQLVRSYGRTPTDSIFEMLDELDGSGFIPDALYVQLTDADFSTPLGQQARLAYQDNQEERAAQVAGLDTLHWCAGDYYLYGVGKPDSVKLCEVLQSGQRFTVLDFWSAWCGPCRAFNRSFPDVYAKYRQQGIEIIGIGAQIREVTGQQVAVEHDHTPWPQYLDKDDHIYRQFHTRVMPFQVLVDGEGHVVKILSYDIRQELKPYLRDPD